MGRVEDSCVSSRPEHTGGAGAGGRGRTRAASPSATVSAFHAAAATAAKTASDAAAQRRPGVVDDRHVDRRRVLGPDHAERSDGEVLHLPGLGVDRETLRSAPSPAPCARRRSRTSGARPRRADHPPRPAPRPVRARRSSTSMTTRAPAMAPSPGPATTLSRNTDRGTRARRGAPARSNPAASSAPSWTTHSSREPCHAHAALDVGGPISAGAPDADRGVESDVVRSCEVLLEHVTGHDAFDLQPTLPQDRARGERRSALGPSRTTSSREKRTRTARPWRSASSRAAAATGEVVLPPNAPPFASGPAGSPPGTHHGRVRLQVGGLDPARRQAHPAVRAVRERAAVEPRQRSCAGPAPCPPARAPRTASRR